jgi:hypothetical protein
MMTPCGSIFARRSTPGQPGRIPGLRNICSSRTGQRGDSGAAVTAAIFWLKTRMRWKETVVNEHAGTIEVGQATPEERAADAMRILDETFGAIARGGNNACL